ncbi:MAG TPA: phosphoribosylglycinamide formyltransferase [Bacteroidia bacterium]|jgi:phosphoribosylglycinamide formyltransferase-1|nr:phosphoribosylglycinamide formyltransferase [Bacteroidia bacterium]
MIRLAIFASGEGTNAQSFIDYFKSSKEVVISLIVSGNSSAKVLERAANAGISSVVIDKDSFYNSNKVVDLIREKADFIVLAGFMWIIPENIIKAFPNKIVNIHPALLPKYGGKGMYGNKVHEAVIANHEKNSGITIHYVNEKYDEGKIIFQKECEVLTNDSPLTLAARVHELEHKYYPIAVEKMLM